jgi:hypothetical protein
VAQKRKIEYEPEFVSSFIIPTGAEPNKVLVSNSEGKAEWKFPSIRTSHIYAIEGEITTNTFPIYFVSLASGEEQKLVKARYAIKEGTKVICELQRNGSGATGFTGLEAKTTAAEVTPTGIKLSENDELALVTSSPEGTPKKLSFAFVIEHII